MRQHLLIKTGLILVTFFLLINFMPAFAAGDVDENLTIDRIALVGQQNTLLQNRLVQTERELFELQQQHDKVASQLSVQQVNKNMLDKIALDISVSKSNLDSINIELTDSQQAILWLGKNIREIENQLNVLGMFGLKAAPNEVSGTKELHADGSYQKKLLALEKVRVNFLQRLQTSASAILQLKIDEHNRLSALLKSRKMMHLKQQQVQDELAYQQQQNYWLDQLNRLYTQLRKVDPQKSKDNYKTLERDIFYSNENANFAYSQSLIARYKDQIQQMKLTVLKSNSISLLYEISDQVQAALKQISRLDGVLKSRTTILEKHIAFLSQKNEKDAAYIKNLNSLQVAYQGADASLLDLNQRLAAFRLTLDHALQVELSARQRFPTFGVKALIDIGKEMLLVPALTFQMMKSISNYSMQAIQSMSLLAWFIFGILQCLFYAGLYLLYQALSQLLERPYSWRERINSKWLSLQWLKRNFFDLVIISNAIAILFFFNIPMANFIFILYLSMVWLIFKGIMTVARLCLVETTHDATGRDTKLFRRLQYFIWIGGVITALTVFVHQLPLIYELQTLCDRLFLCLLMMVSLLLLRSWDVVPNLILSHMESQHPYLQKSICLIGILIPILMFANSVIGLFGFVNLIMTVSRYEGLFLVVLIGYLILRGLLSDGMEQLSRLMIQYVNNGWLWTEAFLKPIDKILRITLFLVAWAVLFLLYGWDKQSPIVERLTRLLHYQLVSVLNTTITLLNILELVVVISVFYWTAKWIREFVYRLLLSRTKDMGIRNSLAILSQYSVILLGGFICLRVLGIDLRALAVVFGMFAFGIGWGLRDLANNFACGFLILVERPLRVGDIVNINGVEGDVLHIGSRAITVRTWDRMELVVPNAEVFNKSFTNWTARDNIVRSVVPIKTGRHDNPHEVKVIIQNVLAAHKDILKDPVPEVLLTQIDDTVMEFEVRYFINIRQVSSRKSVVSEVLIHIWDTFASHGIRPPYPQHEVFLRRGDMPSAPIASGLLPRENEG